MKKNDQFTEAKYIKAISITQDDSYINQKGYQQLKCKIMIQVNPETIKQRNQFARYLEYLADPINQQIYKNSYEVDSARGIFCSHLNSMLIIENIQDLVLKSILRYEQPPNNKISLIEALQELKVSSDTSTAEKYCTPGFEFVQRVALGINSMVL